MKLVVASTFICLVLCLSAQAQTVLVSDIDDTLKISHVLNQPEAAENFFKLGNLFLGSSEVFNALKATGGIQFFYVSNTLDFMEFFHEQFLEQNGFPEGPLLLRSEFGDTGHKFRAISAIIAQTHAKHLILLGDNGERDPETYAELAKAYPEIKITSLIHQVYAADAWWEIGKPLFQGQIAYITSVDLAFHLKKQNLISAESYQVLVNRFVPLILKEKNKEDGVRAFPDWMDCQDYDQTLLDLSSPLLILYAQKVGRRCQ